MIDPKLALALAQHLVMLKQGNVHLFNNIGKALQDVADPEMRHLLAAPKDVVQVQQGRAQMLTELLKVWFQCDVTVAEHLKATQPVMQRTPAPQGGWVNG